MENGLRIGDRISVFCSRCGKQRFVVCRSVSKPYDRLCYSCATAKSHKDNPRIRRGENHYNWKGGVNFNSQGYILEYVRKDNPFYPMATNTGNKRFGGYILQHRLVMARHLNRCLKPTEVVHHIDGDKTNNKINNLRLIDRTKHSVTYQNGYKRGFEDARDKYDISRRSHINVDEYYKE